MQQIKYDLSLFYYCSMKVLERNDGLLCKQILNEML